MLTSVILEQNVLQKWNILFAAYTDVFRPYGIKVYLSVNFASPIRLGKLDTADPLDKEVIGWWKQK